MLVCLLPVRNGEDDLPGYFESVGRFADAIVALDDGSTDRTRELLEAHPLVKIVLDNPRRSSYAGWDDSENRNRLLAAAGELDPDWIVQLDADERIDAGDARALRHFVTAEARRGDGYLMCVYRMIGDGEHYDEAHLWVGRLFAYEPGQTFATDRLHFFALPTSIPAHQQHPITIRIQHLAGLTAAKREARFAKYREVDPDHEYQSTYAHLLTSPGDVKRWWTRSAHLPSFPNQPFPLPEPTDAAPLMSVIVMDDDEDGLEHTLGALSMEDAAADRVEIIVVTPRADRIPQVAHEQFRNVEVVEINPLATAGTARNAGLRVARGIYVAFHSTRDAMGPGWLTAALRAHRQGYQMITGRVHNSSATAAGWATYFLDRGSSSEVAKTHQLREPPAWCASYVRDALLELGGFAEDLPAGEETRANTELFRRGYSAYRAPDLAVARRAPCTTVPELVHHQFLCGRASGRVVREQAALEGNAGSRRVVRFVVRALPGRLRRLTADARADGAGLRVKYWRTMPSTAVAAASWWFGGCYELMRSEVRARRRTIRRS